MHKTEGDGNAANLFQDASDPKTQVEAVWLNAVQEELVLLVNTFGSRYGIAVLTRATDTFNQLVAVLDKKLRDTTEQFFHLSNGYFSNGSFLFQPIITGGANQIEIGDSEGAIFIGLSEQVFISRNGSNTTVGLLSADGTFDRYDLISINTINGLYTVTQGTPSASPAQPAIPAGEDGLYYLLRRTSDDVLILSDIEDIRVESTSLGATPPLPEGYKNGLETSNDVDTDHDIRFLTGICRSDENDGNIKSTSDIVKRIDEVWVEGSTVGGFPSGLTSGNVQANEWYHIFVISKPDGTRDAGYDISVTATNLLADATGYTFYRRVGSVLTDGSSNIFGYEQKGDRIYWNERKLDLSTTTPPTSDLVIGISTPADVKVIANFTTVCDKGTSWNVNFYNLNETSFDGGSSSLTPDMVVGTGAETNSVQMNKLVENSSITYRASSNTVDLLRLTTMGWNDFMGRGN